MNVLNFVFVGLIFLSLAVIVFIFGKNIKKIKEASLREPDVVDGTDVQGGKLSRFFGYLLQMFKRIFVFIAEWFIKHAKKLLHMVHFWLIMLKREKKGDEDLDERAAKEELLNEEEKNLNTLIHDGLGSENDGIKVNFTAKSLEIESEKINNKTETVITEQQTVEEIRVERKPSEKTQQEKEVAEKENKVKNFFLREEGREFDGDNQAEVSEIAAEDDVYGEFQEFEQPEQIEEKQREGFFQKFFSKFSKKKQEEVRDEIEYDQSFSEKDFTDGVVKVQRSDINPKSGNVFVEEVVSPTRYRRDSDIDDELGVDRKILEKKILQKITRDPKNIENYRQLGELYIKMKNYQDAVDAYKYILQMSPRDMDGKRKIEKIKLLKRIN